jgi:predicted amidophosphoribosyltransferase
MVDEDGDCPNWLCTDPRRRITKIDAIAYLSGSLHDKIKAYKYDGQTGWALIFARLLIGWLQQNARDNRPDIIIANPTYIPPGSGDVGHTERIIDVAEREDVLGRWPFDAGEPRMLVKTESTEQSAGSSAAAKRAAAQNLRGVLRITDVSQIEGRHVLVYDDVCTTGSQLDAVAACLIDDGGAADVSAVVLARAPWRKR